ncbi:hypothetical protein ACP8HI_22990 [Paenibacillus sp. FA6]|uniref:hypothetical protein n=1 Tax=Paenibacillus sp. FA6 TaxID=3413029 RepID=UPI003F65ACD2
MKSKRAMIERRNAERRVRREQKRNPPGLLSKLFDRILKPVQVLFIVSLFVAAIYPWFMKLVPGLEGTELIAYTAERIATFLLFGILVTGSIVGTWLLFKRTDGLPSKVRKKPDSKRTQIMKAVVLLFFALVFVVSSIICWAQLKAMARIGQFLLN